MKTMTVRLPDEQAAALDAIARVDEMPVSEAVRIAIDERIAARRADKDFQARRKQIMTEHQRAFELLG